MAQRENKTADIKDVAKAAGVSISTVSNVINKKKPVSAELTAQVNQAIQTLGYEVNPVGRGLKSNKTNQVGVIVPSFNQVYFPAILQGVNEAGAKFGYNISVFETGGDIEREREHVKLLQNSWADGIILASYANQKSMSERTYIRFLAKSGDREKRTPVVSLESILDPWIDAVIIDNEKAAEIAVAHLISLGHTKIAHIAAPLRYQIGALRFSGFKKALERAGLPFYEALICEGDFSPVSGYQRMEKLLGQNEEFTAVFAASDQMGIGALRALLDRGVDVPGEVAVIGIDNNFPSTLVTPSLSSVNLPKYEMGYQAMHLLADRIKYPEKPNRVITLGTKLVIRKSTSNEGSGEWNLRNW